MMNDLISVIVPIYNVELYLRECIESILGQTYKNLEVLLIDDGSTDYSGCICEEYAKRDNRICVYHKANEGLVATRKFGISVAKADYIWFVDGDDYVEADMAAHMINLMQVNQVDFVHTGFFQDEDVRCIGCMAKPEKYVLNEENREYLFADYILEQKKGWLATSLCSKLYKKVLLQKVYQMVPDEQSYCEDVINFVVSILLADSVYFDNHAFYHYRTREGSIYRTNSIRNVAEFGQVIKTLVHICEQFGTQKIIPMVEHYYKKWLINYLRANTDIEICIYEFPEMAKIKKKKIVLYGAGEVGKDYYAQIVKYENCDIVAWVDKNPKVFPYYEVKAVQELDRIQFDCILIAVKNQKIAKDIESELNALGVGRDKILWSEPKYKYES